MSGGYDSALLHFDFTQGNVLSRYDLSKVSIQSSVCTSDFRSTAPPSSGVSLSPPFIQCTSLSASGVVAVGTADGQVWIGAGGEKRSGGKKKKNRKWEGLKENESLSQKIAEGPIVGMWVVICVIWFSTSNLFPSEVSSISTH